MKQGFFSGLLRDFPWLWAISSTWDADADHFDIRVQVADEKSFPAWFAGTLWPAVMGGAIELWVHVFSHSRHPLKKTARAGSIEELVRIQPFPGKTIADAILGSLSGIGCTIDYIVVVKNRQYGPKTIRIFRPPKAWKKRGFDNIYIYDTVGGRF